MTTQTPGKFPELGDTIVGRYQLERMVARGGMGLVYLARQLSMDREVALKMVLPQNQADEQTLARFEREVHLAKQLRHPNVVELYDFGRSEGGFLYLVMEFLKGRDLKKVLATDGPLTVERTGHLALQVLDALAVAHDAGIVHRDLKPSNIFTVTMGRHDDFVKLLDFGIAKSLGQTEDADLTRQGQVCGTSAYMAPEMFLSGAVNLGVDVYAMGLIVLEMLIGRKVIQGNTTAENMVLHLKRSVTVPEPIAGTPLGRVIEKATAKRLEERYADAGEMLDDLEAALEHTPGHLVVAEEDAVGAVLSTTGDSELLDELLGDSAAAPRLDAQTAESSDIVIIESESGNTFGPATMFHEEATAPAPEERRQFGSGHHQPASPASTPWEDSSVLATVKMTPEEAARITESHQDQQAPEDDYHAAETIVMPDGPQSGERDTTIPMPPQHNPGWVDEDGEDDDTASIVDSRPPGWLRSPRVWIPAGVAVGAMLIVGVVVFAMVMSGGDTDVSSEPSIESASPVEPDEQEEPVDESIVAEREVPSQDDPVAELDDEPEGDVLLPPDQRPDPWKIRIDTNPQGATVRAGDQKVGTTPMVIERQEDELPSDIRLTLEGYQPINIPIEASGDQLEINIDRKLERVPTPRKRKKGKPDDDLDDILSIGKFD